MNKNFHHVITAVPARSDVDMKDFEPYFPSLKRGFNNHTVKNNPIETDEIKYIINLYDRAQTEKNKNEDEKILINIRRKLFTILYNYNTKQFMNIFKETKEEIEIITPDKNGTITIYNTNYNIKRI